MPNFEGQENLYLVLFFIVPGLVALFVRSRFITGRSPSFTENFLAFFFLSVVYYSVTIFLLEWALAVKEPLFVRWLLWLALILVGPAAFGLVLGIAAQKEWAARAADKFGITLVHIIPTAWDWRFANVPRDGMFIMVTLASNQRVAGYFGLRSFASSDSAERDLYIEEEYSVSDDGAWEPRPEKVGILVSMREIRHIEFWQPRNGA